MQIRQNRRNFLVSASLAAAAGVIGGQASLADQGPPETTSVRLKKSTAVCFAPLYVVEAFLRAEGFTNIQYVDAGLGIPSGEMMARGELDFDITFAGTVVYHLDLGRPVTAIGGLHVGCYELFAREPVRSVSDLRGRRVGIQTPNSSAHLYLSVMVAHVGLDPKKDIQWATSPDGNALDLFAAGESDAYLGFAPEPQELRDRGIDRVILNTLLDRPWAQYFCCMMYGNANWVQEHPVATKRFLRGMYKAADFCDADPKSAARQIVDGGFTKRYDYALKTIQEIPYQTWHDYDPEDTLRFYALRLYEAGMITNSPNALIAEGTDWSFVKELKHELKA